VNCRIEPQKLKGQTYTAVEMERREYFVGRASDADGAKNAAVGWLMLFMLLVAS
jgi:hypothetical protein